MIPPGQGHYVPIEDDEPLLDTDDVDNQTASPEEASGLQPTQPLRWDHIQNLDEFFCNVYYYHQHGGFQIIVLEHLFDVLKFIFVVFFGVESTRCINYGNLVNQTKSIKEWSDLFTPPNVCWAELPPVLVVMLIVCCFLFSVQLFRTGYRLLKFWEIRRFFRTALHLGTDSALPDLTWFELQQRLIDVQNEVQLCVHKPSLDQLDIYNRILRHKNYLVAMVNKCVLPIKFDLPFIGEYVYLSDGYLYNLHIILFWGPYAPFHNYWQLRQEYKYLAKRVALAEEMANQARILGLINLILCPFIFMAQILIFLCSNAEKIRYEPTSFLGRRWSNYGRLYLRHFNEMNHEFTARVSQGYKPATRYLDCFSTKSVVVLCKNFIFLCGGVFIVLSLLSILREDVIHLPGYLALLVVGGLMARTCSNLVPNENNVSCPKTLLLKTLMNIHYMPDHWKEHAHTRQVRGEFAQLFQYRLVAAIEEILSPIITPLLLIFCVPRYTQGIVDFLRNFTVEVAGVGDICSFAQLDVRRHGNPAWLPADQPVESTEYGRPEGGKTELSLMHFHLTNPDWPLPPEGLAYLRTIRQQAMRDLQDSQFDNPNPLFPTLFNDRTVGLPLRQNVSRMAGPPFPLAHDNNMGVMRAMADSMTSSSGLGAGENVELHHVSPLTSMFLGQQRSVMVPDSSMNPLAGGSVLYERYASQMEDGIRELYSADMSVSALYMHELHHRRYTQRLQPSLGMHRSDVAMASSSSATPVSQEGGIVLLTTTALLEPIAQEEEREFVHEDLLIARHPSPYIPDPPPMV